MRYKQLLVQEKEKRKEKRKEKESNIPNKSKIRKLRSKEIKLSLSEDEADFIVKDRTGETDSSSDEFVYESDSNESTSEISSLDGSDLEKEPKQDKKKEKK